VDELLLSYGREPVFRDALGKHLDNALNNLGFENPNKDINSCENNIKTIKYRFGKLTQLKEELKEVNVVNDQLGGGESELLNEIKKDINKRIIQEKKLLAESRSSILSELKEIDSFSSKKK
jgi:hypothetical protein